MGGRDDGALPTRNGRRLTERLRLEPIGVEHADDLWRLHQDEFIAYWYGGSWTEEKAASFAASCARAWQADGVSKWIAYERSTDALVGRGGLSRLPAEWPVVDQIAGLRGERPWVDQRLEIGWAIRDGYRGAGYATEIGTEGLAFAADVVGAGAVIAFTEVHNLRSRAVMERLAMHYAGEVAFPGLMEGREGVHDDAPFAVYSADRLSA